uniref:Uncharacterized protein n=1 Tax=Setaria viridis TaxID=4556 RepID=A0A4U6SVF6_SETVI|nr:hypothetical protein SEVIR_9G139025v2 [Setaria viridis]
MARLAPCPLRSGGARARQPARLVPGRAAGVPAAAEGFRGGNGLAAVRGARRRGGAAGAGAAGERVAHGVPLLPAVPGAGEGGGQPRAHGPRRVHGAGAGWRRRATGEIPRRRWGWG